MLGFGKKREDRNSDEGPFERMRFSSEKGLLDKLFAQYSLESIVQHLHDSDQIAPLHQMLLAQQLRLTPLLAPRVFNVFEALCGDLDYREQVDLFVFPQAEINAFAFHRLSDDAAHILSMTSEVVKSMTDDELRFTLGHEIGHLGLRHYRVMMVQHVLGQPDDDEQKENRRIPQLLERRLDKWARLAEISADRVGFVACGCDLSVAISSFFKMASGLGPEHLRFDLKAFLSQLEDLESLDRREVLAQFSHPVTPVRARALQLYAAAGGPQASAEALAEVDAEIDRITGLMDYEQSTEFGIQARDFLLAGGLLAAHADGEVTEEEQEVVTRLLLQVTGDPESHFERIESVEQAEMLLAQSCKWLRENAGQERFVLLGQLCHVVASDGILADEEHQFIMAVAARLSIPERAAKDIVHDVLSHYVKTKGGAAAAAFGFRSS